VSEWNCDGIKQLESKPMINSAHEEHEHDTEAIAADSHPQVAPISETEPQDESRCTAELLDRLRRNNATLLHQSQRVEELESVLTCIVHLAAKVRKLERENDC